MVVQPTAQLAPWLFASLVQLENRRASLKFLSVDCSVILFSPEVVYHGHVLFIRVLARTNEVPRLGTSKDAWSSSSESTVEGEVDVSFEVFIGEPSPLHMFWNVSPRRVLGDVD